MKKSSIKYFFTPIIAGKYKGKKIAIPDIDTTRSSKSILKESLFNTLQFDIVDRGFVEVFAGSGSVGLEALSRGAKRSYFIEKNPLAYKTLRANIEAIAPADAVAIHGNSFEEFKHIHNTISTQGLRTFFYFDPPFSIRDNMEDIYEQTIALISSIDQEICEMVIVEHMSSLDMPQTIGKLQQIKKRKFGKSTLSYYRFD